ncbi:MAG: hypothetical protein Q8L41_01410 [Anaerolineales bacterium]|nr:hypothetical protein [Anaerolineales bacterium]MDP2776553.1 hypothetical protein [Anaerolineales bacterium]
MTDFLVPIIFGWPAIIASLGLALAGILLKHPILSLVGAVLYLAPAWYLGFYFSFSFILPLFSFGSAYAVSKGKTALALALMVPILLISGWIGFLVLTQSIR